MMVNKRTFVLTVYMIYSLFFVIKCEDESNTNADSQTGDGQTSTEFEKTALQKGMDNLFLMTNTFLDTVMKDNFYDASGDFNVNSLIDILNKSDYKRLQDDWQPVVHVFGPFAACVILGLLFVLAMPIVGCCYCCCLCCCRKCGGNTKDKHDPPHAKCKRLTFSFFLIICATMMLVGTIMACLSGELLHQATEDKDGAGFVGRLTSNVNRLKKFAEDTVLEVEQEGQEKVSDGIDQIIGEITGTVNNTVKTIKDTIHADTLLQQAEHLGNASVIAYRDLGKVNSSLSTLKDLQTSISNELTSIKNEIDSVCDNLPPSNPPLCPSTSGLTLTVNFTQLTDLQSQLSGLGSAQDIIDLVDTARNEFNNVSRNIDKEVNDTITNTVNQAHQIRNDATKELDTINKTVDPVIKSLDSPLNWTDTNQNTIKDIGDYIWYGSIGLSCVLMLAVLFYYLGILFGACGERPGYQVQCCNKGAGANFMVAGNIWGFLFVSLLMLIVIVLFSAGGLFYTMGCRYINDGVEGVKIFEPVLSKGFKWDLSSSLNVSNATISGALESCKQNEGLYTALYLDQKINLESLLNLTSIKEKVRSITSNSITVSNITLLSSGLSKQLVDFENVKFSDVNFTSFLDQTEVPNQAVIETELGTLADSLNATAGIVRNMNASAADILANQSIRLSTLQSGDVAELIREKNILGEAIRSLQKTSDLTANISSLIDGISDAEKNFNVNASILVNTTLEKTVNNVIDIISSSVNSVIYEVKYNIGKCRPVYDAAQGITDTVCVIFLNPFNGFWFGLGWALFFFIPAFIFAAVLNWLYRKEEPYRKHRKGFDDPDPTMYSGGYRHEDHIPLATAPH